MRRRRTAPLASPLALLCFVILCFGVGRFAGLFPAASLADWYPTLTKPPWTPANSVFPIVWPLVYLAMAIAAWLVWKSAGYGERAVPMCLFLVQLVLNGAWSPLFFGLQAPLLGLIDNAALTAAIAFTLVAFGQVSRIAGFLFLPYLLWTLYMATISFEVWRLNS